MDGAIRIMGGGVSGGGGGEVKMKIKGMDFMKVLRWRNVLF